MNDQQDPNSDPGFDQGSTPNDPTQIHNLSDLNASDLDATAEHPAVPQDATAAIPPVDAQVPPTVQPAADPYAAEQGAGQQLPPPAPGQVGYNQAGYQAPPPGDDNKSNLTALWIVLAIVAAVAIGLGGAALFASNNNKTEPVTPTQTITETSTPTQPTFDPTTPTFDPTTPTFDPTTPTTNPQANSGNAGTPSASSNGSGNQGFNEGGRANSAP
ncbi:MAG: hypothetical protein WAS05_09020 [Candidatus Nanopelagicales bacterium]